MRNSRKPFRFFSEPYFCNTRIAFIVLLVCLVITQNAAAQFMKLTRFAEDEGLTNSLVKSVTTDRNGLIWIATDGGVFLYDGHEFTHLSEGFPSPYVKSVFTLENGDIFVTTDLGVVAVDSRTRPLEPRVLMKGSVKQVDSLLWFPKGSYEDSKKRLWFGDNRKIYCLDNGKMKAYFPGEKAITNNFQRSFSFTEDGYGHLFSISEPGFVYRFDPAAGSFSEVRLPAPLTNTNFVLTVSAGTLLLATRSGIVEMTVDKKGECVKLTPVKGSPEASCLFRVDAAHFYAGTWANGLFEIQKEGTQYTTKRIDEFTEKNINNIVHGSENSVWIASDNGLFQMHINFLASPFRSATTDYIQRINEFPDGKICFTDGKKVFVSDPGNESFPSSAVKVFKESKVTLLQVVPTHDGTWYSDVNGWVWLEDPGGKTVKRFSFSSSGRAVFFLMSDQGGNLWAIQDENSSLIRISPDLSVRFYGADKGITSRPLVTAMNPAGIVFAGGMKDSAFLFKYDPAKDRFVNLSKPLGFVHNIDININDMVFSRKGTLWLGSSFGLIRYEDGLFRRMDLGPLTDGSVKAITVDHNDNLWLGNSAGLQLYTDDQLLSFDNRTGLSSKIISYRCLHVDQSNRLWVGTVEGIMVTAPLIPPQKTRKPFIYNILLNNKKAIEYHPAGTIFNNRSFATFTVGVSDYPVESFTIMMMLQGRDTCWQPVPRSGSVILANLDPGSYTLLIRARKTGNNLYSENFRWQFTVSRIWYSQSWVILVMMLLTLFLIWLGVRWYTISLKRRNDNLERLIQERTRETLIQKEKIEAQNISIMQKNQELNETNLHLEKAKELAEEASDAERKFLSVMSHELRTPLNAVIGAANLLVMNTPRPDQSENLKILRFSAENLLELINNILDFNKIESGKVTLEKIPFNIRNLINEIVSTMHIRAREKNILMTADIDKRVPEYVIGDSLRLSQVVNNLLGNALKFTEKGAITISLTLQSLTKTDAVIGFVVSDTGIGMSTETLDNLFESFVQASSETTRKYGGTGLGLAITRRILDLFGSSITVESESGKGTTFRFPIEFPVGDVSETQERTRAESYVLSGFTRQRILLVEDNQINRLIAVKFLTDWNFDVETAENGLEAISKVKEKRFDIILMDLQMPEMDGIQASEAIRAMGTEPYLTIPIIALTAATKSEVSEIIFASGMNDFISKPFNPVELHQKLTKYLFRKE